MRMINDYNTICDNEVFHGYNRKYELAAVLTFSEMVQSIMTNDELYTFLIYFYLDEISDWLFEQEIRYAVEKGICEREYLSCYFASRIPGEDCYNKLIAKIKEIAAKP